MATPLSQVIALLEELAPLRFAEAWDNVGLLVEPPKPRGVTRALLTIDLTEPVLEEALEAGAQLVVAYHPPLFKGMKRLTQRTPGERVITRALAEGIAIYSPHTALDAAPGGLNDWLCDLLGAHTRRPITQRCELDAAQALKLVTFVPQAELDEVRVALAAAGAGHIGDYEECAFISSGHGHFLPTAGADPHLGQVGQRELTPEQRLEVVCSRRALPHVAQALVDSHPYEEPAWDVYPLEPKPLQGTGAGRIAELTTPAELPELVTRIKAGLGLHAVRVATASLHQEGAPITRVAVCPGAGGSLFEALPPPSRGGPELYFTGEMRHHDVLGRVAEGASVVLCDHTNTERGYLPRLKSALEARLSARGEQVSVHCSQRDQDPLEVV
ncbi:MAG: Nif3-like dinuclear metal center hexameric protein [Polyangiaceae bacterium]|nr:Nif3-like dinuclear metal center hexameric protein [Polyangiaceae bacterium]MCW5792122.1 Nif3-like dinuclear metal center hexameric protein [Polyangiaceae bacterium]